MFLKQFPEDVKLGVMIEMVFVLLQSILMRAQEIIDSRNEKVCADDL